MITKPYKLVIVEDDEDICSVLTDYLENLYPQVFKIQAFQDPVAALDYMIKNPPNMVITDINMPGKYGDTMLNEIREYTAGIITIIITGYPSFSVMVSAFKDGTHGFLIKPFDGKDLNKVIDPCLALLGNWEGAFQRFLENKNM